MDESPLEKLIEIAKEADILADLYFTSYYKTSGPRTAIK